MKVKLLGFPSEKAEEALNAWLSENPDLDIENVALCLNPGGNYLTVAVLYQEAPGKGTEING